MDLFMGLVYGDINRYERISSEYSGSLMWESAHLIATLLADGFRYLGGGIFRMALLGGVGA